MKKILIYNPATLFGWFLSVIVLNMFFMEPFMITVSMIGGGFLLLLTQGLKRFLKKAAFYLLLTASLAFFNLVFSHKGLSVMFYINNRPITKESLIYGVFTGIMISTVLVWFDNINYLLSCDAFIYMSGKIFPKVAMLFSLCLKMITEYIHMSKQLSVCAASLGYKKSGLKGKFLIIKRTFSSLIIKLPENNAETALSMLSRGYGAGRRTSFFPFFYKKRDIVLTLLLVFFLTVSTIACLKNNYAFYPYFSYNGSYLNIAVGLYPFVPALIVITDMIKRKNKRAKKQIQILPERI